MRDNLKLRDQLTDEWWVNFQRAKRRRAMIRHASQWIFTTLLLIALVVLAGLAMLV
jgi:hypothetical protein